MSDKGISKKDMNLINKWYKENKGTYERLSTKIESVIKEILEAEDIKYSSISSRTKELDSFDKKASQEKYSDPINQIKDLSGIRITCYVESDVEKISKVIEREFKIDFDHYNDKSGNKFGYRSVHYVASLNEVRSNITEFRILANLEFEIQIRTILQHAWAEIEHDRGYKFHDVLPEYSDIKNRFAVIAGILKLADAEFDSIVSDIDKYAKKVGQSTIDGKLDIQIDSVSLKEYLNNKFNQEVNKGVLLPTFGRNDSAVSMIISELNNFGINQLSQLDQIIPLDFTHRAAKELSNSTFLGLLRTLMMINDIDIYFSKAWNQNWSGMDVDGLSTLKNYGVPINEYMKKYKISLFDDHGIVERNE